MKMKNVIGFICSLFLSLPCLFSQETLDVVYLKDGTSVIGHTFVDMPDKLIKIKSLDGVFIMYPYSEIDKIVKASDLVNLDNYGRGFSRGVSIRGGISEYSGMLGVPLRFQLSPMVSIESEVAFRFISINPRYPKPQKVYPGLTFSLGSAVYFSKFYHQRKQKVKLNGLAFSSGYNVSKYSEILFSIGWNHESFRLGNHNESFIFEAGTGVTYFSPEEDRPVYPLTGEDLEPFFYLKCRWNFYKEKK